MIDVREIRDDELPRWRELAEQVTPIGSVESLLDWRRQAEDMTWLVATVDGEDAGTAIGIVGWHSPPGVGSGEAYVLPAFRGRGVGTELFRELARFVGERGCVELETAVAEDDHESLEWAHRRGFREVGRWSTLVLDLTRTQVPEPGVPEGVEIVTWADRPELARGMYEVFAEASPDIPGEESAVVPDFEQWLSDDMQGAGDRPEATFIALAGDEVVGYAKLAIGSSRPKVAEHDLTGVKRAWRGRGIAGALKRAEIAWAKEHGYERLETRNEERNEPIRRLNEEHGYTVAPGAIVLRTSVTEAD